MLSSKVHASNGVNKVCLTVHTGYVHLSHIPRTERGYILQLGLFLQNNTFGTGGKKGHRQKELTDKIKCTSKLLSEKKKPPSPSQHDRLRQCFRDWTAGSAEFVLLFLGTEFFPWLPHHPRTTSCNSGSRVFAAPFWPLLAPALLCNTHNTHTHNFLKRKMNIFKKKRQCFFKGFSHF